MPLYPPPTVESDLGTIAYAANQSASPTSFTTAAVIVEGCVVTVPPIERDVWLEWGGLIGIATADLGVIVARAYEITGGVATVMESSSTRWESGAATTSNGPSFIGKHRLGPTVAERTFALYGFVIRDGASTLAANFRNGNGAAKTYLTAVAR